MRLTNHTGHRLRIRRRVYVRGGAHAQLLHAAQTLSPEIWFGGESAILLGQIQLLGALLQLLARPVGDPFILLAVAIEDQLLILGAHVLLGPGYGRQAGLLLLLVQLTLHPVGQVEGTALGSARLVEDAALFVNQQLNLLHMSTMTVAVAVTVTVGGAFNGTSLGYSSFRYM